MPGVGTQMVDATSYLSQGFGPIPGVRIYSFYIINQAHCNYV